MCARIYKSNDAPTNINPPAKKQQNYFSFTGIKFPPERWNSGDWWPIAIIEWHSFWTYENADETEQTTRTPSAISTNVKCQKLFNENKTNNRKITLIIIFFNLSAVDEYLCDFYRDIIAFYAHR